MQQSDQESRPARLGFRFRRSAPHFGALVVGAAALWGWGRLIDADILEGGFGGVVYLVLLMFAPVVGASAVVLLQSDVPVEERRQILALYIWWAIAGLCGLLLLVLSAGGATADRAAPPVVQIAFWAVFLLLWLVPVVVPLVRAVRWLVLPGNTPRITTDPEQ